MEARDLDDAIDLVNATGYGLTSGLESLDDREQELWCSRIRAGNLYINRPTTGAIVLRQPFGGMGKSSVGPGIKAGGPNYIVPLMRFEEKGDWSIFAIDDDDHPPPPAARMDLSPFSGRPELLQELSRAIVGRAGNESQATETEFRRVLAAITSYERWAQEEFHAMHDHFRLLGEDNFRRYVPVEPLRIRIHPDDSLCEIFCRAAAAQAAGCRATISSTPKVGPPSRGGQVASSAARLAAPTAAAAVELLDRVDRLVGRCDRVHRRR